MINSKEDWDRTQARHAREEVYLKPLYKKMEAGLRAAKINLEKILPIEEEYNTFQNDAMREVLNTITNYLEQWT
jgi:hypothetical protein